MHTRHTLSLTHTHTHTAVFPPHTPFVTCTILNVAILCPHHRNCMSFVSVYNTKSTNSQPSASSWSWWTERSWLKLNSWGSYRQPWPCAGNRWSMKWCQTLRPRSQAYTMVLAVATQTHLAALCHRESCSGENWFFLRFHIVVTFPPILTAALLRSIWQSTIGSSLRFGKLRVPLNLRSL